MSHLSHPEDGYITYPWVTAQNKLIKPELIKISDSDIEAFDDNPTMGLARFSKIITLIEPNTPESPRDFNKLHMKVYLTQVAGVDLGYVFEWKKFPYCDALANQYSELRVFGDHARELADFLTLKPEVVERVSAARNIFQLWKATDISKYNWLLLLSALRAFSETRYGGMSISELSSEQRQRIQSDIDWKVVSLEDYSDSIGLAWVALGKISS